ncbi:MAG TPA: hypothetical protein VMZ91_10545, partial [Candidatus Paceibacterota bacterium]|nr:hypothetical protein [Candidatus Paceibacterota bacterium]
DSIFIEKNSGGELIIQPRFKKINGEKIIEIDINNKKEHLIKKEIVSAYTSGSTSIIFKGKNDKKSMNDIKSFIKDLMSFEMTESNDKIIIFKDFFNLEEMRIKNFLMRIDNDLKEMFNILGSSIEKGSISTKEIKEIEKIDVDITKIWLLISRFFFKGLDNPSIINTLKTDNLDFFSNWWLAFNLENIGDHLKSISNILHLSKINRNDKQIIKKIFLQIKEEYVSSISSFFKKNKSEAIASAMKGKEILRECDKLSKSKNSALGKLAVIFRELETQTYQNLKIVMYSTQNENR